MSAISKSEKVRCILSRFKQIKKLHMRVDTATYYPSLKCEKILPKVEVLTANGSGIDYKAECLPGNALKSTFNFTTVAKSSAVYKIL